MPRAMLVPAILMLAACAAEKSPPQDSTRSSPAPAQGTGATETSSGRRARRISMARGP